MDFEYLELSLRPCPLCDGLDFKQLKDNDRYFMGIKTVGCNKCGLVQTNPRPSRSGLQLFYENDYRKFYQGVLSPNQEYINRYNKNLRLEATCGYLARFFPFDKLNSTILDIGCSEGALFSAMRGRGFRGKLSGVEPNSDFAKYASDNNDAIVVSELDDIVGKYNLITINHVYEHLLDPYDFLIKLKKHLKVNGILYIDVPDIEEYSSLNDLHIAHVFHFSIRTLRAILIKSGFEIMACEKYVPLYHPKSIRVVARIAKETCYLPDDLYSVELELSVWNVIKRISVIKKRIKEILKYVPGVKFCYERIKKHFL